LKQSFQTCLFILSITFLLVASFPIPALSSCSSEYEEVDCGYLTIHIKDFSGMKVKTAGMVHFMASYYMFEDFWLGGIPVVVRFAMLPDPPQNSSIVVCGIIEYSEIEGGFYFLNAHSWTYEGTMPEFPSFLIPTLFIAAPLLAAIVCKRKYH